MIYPSYVWRSFSMLNPIRYGTNIYRFLFIKIIGTVICSIKYALWFLVFGFFIAISYVINVIVQFCYSYSHDCLTGNLQSHGFQAVREIIPKDVVNPQSANIWYKPLERANWDRLWGCTTGDAFNGLTLLPARTSNYIHYKVWDKTTDHLPNFNGATVDVWECISSFISDFSGHVIAYPCWDCWDAVVLVKHSPLVSNFISNLRRSHETANGYT